MKLKYLLPSLLLLASSAFGQNTQLTGTLQNVDGTGFNGTLYLSISQVAGVSPNGSCGGPVQVVPNASLIVSIQSGTMSSYIVQGNPTVHTGAPKIYGSDCTLPVGVPYNAVLRDLQGNISFSQLWLIVGSTQDIGTVTANTINPQALNISVIAAMGVPTGVCSNTQLYIQENSVAGVNEWLCVNGTWTQQIGSGGGGGGGGGVSIGGLVTGSNTQSVLYVDSSNNLAQDTSSFFYDGVAHRLTVANLTSTNPIAASITGASASAAVASALASTPTPCGSGLALTGIVANGNPAGCIGVISPVGATNEVQAKASSGALRGAGVIADGATFTALVPVILAANPTSALGAATKQYVDNAIVGLSGAVLNTPPGNQVVQQIDGTSFSITNTGSTTGVNFILGAHVNLLTQGGTVSLTSPDSQTTLTLDNTGIKLAPSTSGYTVIGGRLVATSASLNSSTTIGANGEYIDIVDATTGSLTETLPAAAAVSTGRQMFVVTKKDATLNTVTIAAGAGDTINGFATLVISGQFNSATLVSDGVSNWTTTALTSVTSGVKLQTNAVNNSSQALLNLTNGPGITITEQNGKIVVANTYAINSTPLGILQNVDWPPSIINIMNDEFTDTVFNASNIWTVVNQGTDTIANKNSLLSINAVAHSGDNFVGIYQLTPATAYAVTSKITLTGMQVSGYYGGLAVRDSATGKVVSLRIGNGSTLTVDHWNSPTSLASSVYTQAVDSAAPVYLSIKDDSTNFTFYFSRDGVNFIPVFSESRTAFLSVPGQVGYMAGSSNATYPMELGSDWFRRTL